MTLTAMRVKAERSALARISVPRSHVLALIDVAEAATEVAWQCRRGLAAPNTAPLLAALTRLQEPTP